METKEKLGACKVFLCFVALVRVRSIMLTSLYCLFYVTGECYRFLLRGSTLNETFSNHSQAHHLSNRFEYLQYSKHPHITEHMISEVRLIGFLFNGCLVTSQPQSVLKMFLNFYISNTGTTPKCPNVTVGKSITV